MKYRLLPFLIAVAASAQPYLNLDFETAIRGGAWGWSTGSSAAYQYTLDTQIFESGASSLQINGLSATAQSSGSAGQNLPLALVAGHHIQISGWIKTVNVSQYAALWLDVEGGTGNLSLDYSPNTGPAGTSDWTQFSLQRDVSASATSVTFGVTLSGPGTAWFDNLSIAIDGAPFVPGPAPYIGEPPQPELDWINSNAISLAGTDPTLPLDDLAPLKNLIGTTHVVALGEDTYGTREFLQVKHRVIEYLATQMGFTIFAIEANMPEARALNDYVLNGAGDPAILLRTVGDIGAWNYNAQEVLDMLKWMRQFNQSGAGQVQFTGFDMADPTTAAGIVENFVAKADPSYLNSVYSAYAQLTPGNVKGYGLIYGALPAAAAAGHHIKFTGFIKPSGVTAGYAGLWMNASNSSNNVIAYGGTVSTSGTSDWMLNTIDLDIPASATFIAFGGIHAGNGTAWFDTFEVDIDGVPFSSPAFDFDFESRIPLGFNLLSEVTNNFLLRLDPTVAHTGKQSAASRYGGPEPLTAPQILQQANSVVTHLTSSRSTYSSNGIAAADIEWGIQAARIVAQSSAYQIDYTVREPDMAANIQWVLNQAPAGAKIAIFSHNRDISRSTGTMGAALAGVYGKDYLPIALAFNDGTYNAIDNQGNFTVGTASSPFPGSFEYVFNAAGSSPLILDLRLAVPGDPGSGWLFGEQMFRTINYFISDGFTPDWTLPLDFDGIIFVAHTTPSTLLPLF